MIPEFPSSKEMQLEIRDFKSITNKTIDFPLKGLVLLNGPSGSGKSTILEALYKCLYSRKGSSLISLRTSSYNIKRDRSKLFVIVDGKEANGEEFISNKFGPEELWLCSSYLPQGLAHNLFDMDESSKISLLTQLAFEGTDGDSVIARCKEERKREDEKKTIKEAEILVEKTLYEDFRKKNPSVKEGRCDPLPEDDIKTHKSNVRVWEKSIPRIKDQITNLKIQLSTLKVQLSEREDLEKEIFPLADRTQEISQKEEEMDFLQKEKEKWDIYTMREKILKIDTPDPILPRSSLDTLSGYLGRGESLLVLREKTQKELPKKEKELDDLQNFNKDNLILKKLSILDQCTIDDISSIPKALETLRRRESFLLELSKIPEENPMISEEHLLLLPTVSTTIGSLKESIESFRKFDLYDKYSVLASRLSDVENQEDDIKTYREAYQIAELNKNCMNCPSCNKRLFIQNGKLCISETEIGIDSKTISDLLKKALSDQEIYRKSEEAKKSIRELFPILPEKCSRPTGQRYSESLLEILNLYDPSLNIEEERRRMKNRKLRKEFLDRLSYLESYPFTLEVAEKTKELTKDFPPIKSVKKEKETLEASLTRVSYTGIETEKSLSAEITKLRTILSLLSNLREDTTIEREYLHHSNREERKKYPMGSKEADKPSLSLSEILEQISERKKEIEYLKKETIRYQTLKRRLDSLPSILAEKESKEKIEKKELLLKEYTEGLLETSNILHMEKLGTLELQLRNITALYNRYVKIEEVVKRSQKDLLESFLFILSENVTEALNEMRFEGPIRVDISTVFEKKSGGESRKFNVKISYKGIECKYTDLSGGERSRFYLALSIAFSKLSGIRGGVLLIDETISTLDSVTRDKVVEVVQRHLPEKLIIVVNHDSSQGLYDEVVSLS